MDSVWPWLLLGLLGAYHGLNPAMGWLFAVSLGMQERSRAAVLRALPPIAIGHEASIVLVVLLVTVLGVVADARVLHLGAGAALIAFGVFRFAKPRWHPRWTRMRVNRRELTLWSFLMSSAHGAGLMVAPVLLGAGATAEARAHEHGPLDGDALSLPGALLATVLHVSAMLAVMAVVAVVVYEKLGVAVLRRTWVNSDHVWAAAFVFAGVVTLLT
jgi:hypothetical protein